MRFLMLTLDAKFMLQLCVCVSIGATLGAAIAAMLQ